MFVSRFFLFDESWIWYVASFAINVYEFLRVAYRSFHKGLFICRSFHRGIVFCPTKCATFLQRNIRPIYLLFKLELLVFFIFFLFFKTFAIDSLFFKIEIGWFPNFPLFLNRNKIKKIHKTNFIFFLEPNGIPSKKNYSDQDNCTFFGIMED